MKRCGPGYYTFHIMLANDLATKETAVKLLIICLQYYDDSNKRVKERPYVAPLTGHKEKIGRNGQADTDLSDVITWERVHISCPCIKHIQRLSAGQ